MPHLLAFGRSQRIAVTRNTPVDHLESDQFAHDTLGFLLFQHSTVDELLALGKLRNPPQTGLDGRSRIVDVVAIKAESFLQTERIARTETDVLQSVLGTGFPKRHPKFLTVLVRCVNFATARTGIPRNRKNDAASGHSRLAECIILHLLDRLGAHFLYDFHRQRPLYSQLADFVRRIVEFLAVASLHAERLALGTDMGPILVDVSRIDAQHIGLGVEPVDENVVDDTAPTVWHTGILHLAVVEFRDVVGRDVLQQGERFGPLDPDFAHVADIENAGSVAYGGVFVVDARELDRHVVAREFGHLGTGSDMMRGKCCGFHNDMLFFRFFRSYSFRFTPNRGQRWNSFVRSNK